MNRHFSLLTCILFFLLTSWVSVSAKSGDLEKAPTGTNSGTKINQVDKIKKDQKEWEEIKRDKTSTLEESETWSRIEINEIERRKVETKLKKDINSYIIESYKAQWNKIIKDLSIKLTKTIAEPEERKLAYEKIQESLKSRLDKTEDLEGSDSKKEILQEFLRHLIQLLDKKIEEIEK